MKKAGVVLGFVQRAENHSERLCLARSYAPNGDLEMIMTITDEFLAVEGFMLTSLFEISAHLHKALHTEGNKSDMN